MSAATIEATSMGAIRGLRLSGAITAFGLASSAVLIELRAQAPEPPSEAQLIERLRQIQRAIGAPDAPPPAAGEAGPAPASTGQIQQPQLAEDQVRRKLQDDMGVDVLRVRLVDPDGRPAYAITVMNPPGNYNAAFMVSTLLVDGDTGEILGEARAIPGAEDPDVLPAARSPAIDSSGREIRRRTHR